MCTKCHKIKPLDQFNRDSRRLDGRRAQCRECQNKHRVETEKDKIRKSKWKQDNPEKHKQHVRKYMKKQRENITPQYIKVLTKQTNPNFIKCYQEHIKLFRLINQLNQ